MPNSYFQFKQFTIHQDRCAMKVTTDACLFAAWVAGVINNEQIIINNCLDIGGGTGLLSIMLAQKINTEIDCIEIDKNAANQAKENADSSPWKERINIFNADVKTFPFEKKYDVIICNPPFYEKEIRSSKENKNIAHHSDELKLSDVFGLIKKNLAENGSFFLLLPYKRNEEIKTLLKGQHMHIEKIVFARQTTKHDYFRIMLKGKSGENNHQETMIDDISIAEPAGGYTQAFTALLNDYYLYL